MKKPLTPEQIAVKEQVAKDYAVRIAAFAADLKDLLIKHNGCILWSCGEGSDTHGIHNESMGLSLTMPHPSGGTHFGDYVKISEDGGLCAEDF